jgi:hypothetical protein
MFTNEMQIAIANQRTWQQTGLTQNLKPVTNTQDETPAISKLLDGVHDGREPSKSARAEVVSIGKPTRDDDRVVRTQIGVAVPDEVDRLPYLFGNDVICVVIAIGSWKNYDAEFHVLNLLFLSTDYTDYADFFSNERALICVICVICG